MRNGNKADRCELCIMKKIKFLSLVGTTLIGLTQPAWAGPHGGGGGFGGGGHFGGSGHFGGYSGGGSRAAPAFSGGGARFGGIRGGGFYRAPQSYHGRQFYRGGARMSAVRPHSLAGSSSRSITGTASGRAAINRQSDRASSIAGRNRASDPRVSTAVNRQPNRIGSIAGQNRLSGNRTSTAAKRQSFVSNHASERHDANWHRDWDRHHSHFHHHKVFVFINGFWWGLDPWFYPYYANDYYPYDDYGYYPDDYSANPNDYYGDYGYYDDPGYAAPDQSANNATVSAVQSQLAKLGYYGGAIDGILGDQTEEALARYQEDHDLSVTGTVTAATLQSLGLARGAS
jgi:hypothetical protein